MKTKLLFFDHNEEFVQQYRQLTLASDRVVLDFDAGDIRDIMCRHSPHIIVSPANCYGWMDGGIDNVYRELFPEVETRVKKRISAFGVKTWRADYVIPIGSAILVPTGPCVVGEIATKLVACVPTMFTPQNIQDSPTNVYWAMRALLNLLHIMDRNCALDASASALDGKETVVVCPCFGTGVGALSIEESVRQVQAAMFDFAASDKSIADPKCEVRVVSQPSQWAYVLSNHANRKL